MITPPTASPPFSSSSRIPPSANQTASDPSAEPSSTWPAETATGPITWREHQTDASIHIPGYTMLGEVGRGGMGIVYRARQDSLNRLVAIKMISGGCLASPEDRFRFRVEAEVAGRIKHPNVVQIHEAGLWQGQHYLVMEWVDGGNLHEWQSGRPIEPRRAAEILAQLAEGVHAAHALGVIHRDLKPANVLLAVTESQSSSPSHDWTSGRLIPKVADFGMAKRLMDPGSVTRTGCAVGTPQYMAPEQARGAPVTGTGADIYGLGAILYELLSGHPPFEGVAHLIIYQLVTHEPRPLGQIRPYLPPDLIAICQKCMAPHPEERYASAAELAADLRRLLNGEAVSACPEGRLKRLMRWTRRRPAIASLAALLVITVLGGFAATSWLYFKADQERAKTLEALQSLKRQREGLVQFNRFVLRDVYGQATPTKARGEKLLLVDALKRAASDLENDSALEELRSEHPDILAYVRFSLGSSLLHQGELDLAESLLRKALPWYETHQPDDDRDLLHIRNNLLHLALDQGKFAAAEAQLRVLADVESRVRGATSHPAVAAKSNLVGVLTELGRQAEATAIMRDLWERLSRERRPGDEETILMHANVAFLEYRCGHFATAETVGRAALAECRDHLPDDHPHRLIVLNNLSSALRALERLEEAEPLARQAHEGSVRINGDVHPQTIGFAVNYAGLLRDTGQLDRAEGLLRQTWQNAKDKKVRHPALLRVLDALAGILTQKGELQEASALAAELLQAVQEQLDPKHQLHAQARFTQGEVWLNQKQYDAALERFRESLKLAQPHGAALLGLRKKTLRCLVQCAHALGRSDDAKDYQLQLDQLSAGNR